MGECGCGSFSAEKVVRIGNRILAIEIYSGCGYCDTGVIVTLHVFDPEEAKAFSLEGGEDFAPGKHGHAQIDIPLVGPEDLIAAAKDIGETIGPDGYDSLDDYLADNALDLIQRAIRKRREQGNMSADMPVSPRQTAP